MGTPVQLSAAEEQTLRRLLRSARDDAQSSSFVAVRVDPKPGASEEERSGTWCQEDFEIQLHRCRSPLELRFRLRDSSAEQDAFLVEFDDRELSSDLAARLFRRAVHQPDTSEVLRDIFQAKQIDRRIRGDRDWLVPALLSLPPDAVTAAPGAVLSLDHAHETLWRELLGFRRGDASGRALLEWVSTDDRREKWLALDEPLQDGFLAWAGEFSDLLVTVLTALRHADARTVVAIGLLARLVESPGGTTKKQDQQVTVLTTRLTTRFLDDAALEERVASAWADAAESWLSSSAGTGDRQWVLERAATLLEDDLSALADRSTFLLQSLEAQRHEITLALSSGLRNLSAAKPVDTERLKEAVATFEAHRALSLLEGSGLEREASSWWMAARALCWLSSAKDAPGGLAELLEHASVHLGWIDRARAVLHSDPSVQQHKIVHQLGRRIDAAREELNRLAAEKLALWYADGSPTLDDHFVHHEDVLRSVAGPLAPASKSRVLMLVLDGMAASNHEALREELAAVWQEWVPAVDEGEPARPLLALPPLPTTTSVCRTSLLTGSLQQGSQADEKKHFGRIQELRAPGMKAPLIFHKAEVGIQELGESVLQALDDPKQKVLGVVVNVIDDQLDASTQGAIDIGLRTTPVLEKLLAEAASAGLTVLLVTDHGHLLDAGTEKLAGTGGSARHRSPSDDGALAEGEIEVHGTRVVGGPWVLAWSESVRYRGMRRGYHGGLSLQEFLTPVSVLTPRDLDSSAPELLGWQRYDPVAPSWWSLRGADVAEPATAAKAKARPAPQMTLLEADEPQAGELVQALRASQLFSDQVERNARSRIASDDVLAVVARLDGEPDHRLRLDALAAFLGKSERRMNGLLAGTQKVLNIEGYEVLRREGGDVVLNRELLRIQFAL